ncbi:agmatine deiminase family protein [Streptomyces sp. 147326]|uniref:agmatine deiminase family protein n=1 Tax=Streptomyces sp. 147326 TaxID=3074379 RepID=UPI003857468B
MTLEGGALTVDGEGTLITTEQCLLHTNRNPRMSRADIEDELKRRLGVEKVIWLPYGGLEDTETDGHVDGVAAYVAPAKVVVSLPEDPAHPDCARMRANLAVLASALPGRTVVGVPTPALAYGGGGIHCITQQLHPEREDLTA